MKGKDEFQFKLLFGHGLMTLRQLKKLGDAFADRPVKVINVQRWKEMGEMPVRDVLKKFR